jgi:diguanylate cyclase (GGDEF)-like protein
MNVSVAGLISIVFTWCINMYRMSASLNASKLEKERDKYHDQSIVDELTRLRNRRDFTQVFQRYLTNYRDVDKFLCLGIIDVDHFKRYNDRYGHPKGDECLRLLAGALIALQDNMGVYVARIGGEEFALLWFEEDRHRVSTVVSYLQRRIRELNISHENSITAKRLTISLGVFVAPCGVYDTTQAIYNFADSVLYEAKGKGRNCAVILNGDEKQHIPG